MSSHSPLCCWSTPPFIEAHLWAAPGLPSAWFSISNNGFLLHYFLPSLSFPCHNFLSSFLSFCSTHCYTFTHCPLSHFFLILFMYLQLSVCKFPCLHIFFSLTVQCSSISSLSSGLSPFSKSDCLHLSLVFKLLFSKPFSFLIFFIIFLILSHYPALSFLSLCTSLTFTLFFPFVQRARITQIANSICSPSSWHFAFSLPLSLSLSLSLTLQASLTPNLPTNVCNDAAAA